jgi:hypothetical protein
MKKAYVLVLFLALVSADVLAQSTREATNLVVDFDRTSFDSSISPGDSGILNLVITNTGGYQAENVKLYLPGTSSVYVDKKFDVGRISSGESKTFPVVVRAAKDAQPGLTAVNIRITFDGFRSDGTRNNNQISTWDMPLRIRGRPMFQVNPSKTTLYLDTLDDLSFQGVAAYPVKDLRATLSSTCLTVLGSSTRYIGELGNNLAYAVDYSVKPVEAGACELSLELDYTDESGDSASDIILIGILVDDAGVDFKVAGVSYTPTGPGQQTEVNITLKNVGKASAERVSVSLGLSSPFSPVKTSEAYLPTVAAQESVDVGFLVAVGWEASNQVYTIPLTIRYNVGGTTYTEKKEIGLDVAGEVILEVIRVSSSGSSLNVDVANIGTRSADAVKATLIISDSAVAANRSARDGNRTDLEVRQPMMNASDAGAAQRIVSYKSDIKPNRQTTFTFSTTHTGPATLEIEYTGPNNERVIKTERITLGSNAAATARVARTTTQADDSTNYYLVAGVAILGYFAYRKYKKKKR